jgi:hypothetical protein
LSGVGSGTERQDGTRRFVSALIESSLKHLAD